MVDISIPTLLAQIINFLILVALLAKFAYKPLTKILDERKEKIAHELETAESERASAQELRHQYQEQLNKARMEAQAIVEKAAKQAELEAQSQLQELRVQIEREKKQAQEEMSREREKALTDLRGDVVALSMAAAGKIIGRNMNAEDDARLVGEFIDQLDKSKLGGQL